MKSNDLIKYILRDFNIEKNIKKIYILCVSGSVNLSAVKIKPTFSQTYYIIQIYVLVSVRSYNCNKIELFETSLIHLDIFKRTAY